MAHFVTPTGLVGFGKDANCTLDLCSLEYSVFEYLPSLPANSIFLALFAISGLLHVYQGIRSRQRFYMWATVLGCITEVTVLVQKYPATPHFATYTLNLEY
jgi:hypothetical protein